MSIQNFGETFSLEKLMRAREVARNLTYELSVLIQPGMIESEALEIYEQLCLKYSIHKQWHQPKIRFGPNTTKNFSEPSEAYVLKEEDLFLIDIGPVIDGHEADFGETFVIGHQYEHKLITQTSVKIFNEVSRYWKESKTTGPKLYEFASRRAQVLGFKLNLGNDGHRIGDFPHHVHFRGGLAECQEQVIPNAWILEIHLLGPHKNYGAFYEDLLA